MTIRRLHFHPKGQDLPIAIISHAPHGFSGKADQTALEYVEQAAKTGIDYSPRPFY